MPKNYHIAIIAPSGRLSKTDVLTRNISYLKELGHQVCEGEHLMDTFGPFAGKDQNRKSDLQWAMDHPEVEIIWMARGGYGMNRIIDDINLDAFKSKPKLIIGFSDITALFLDPRLKENTFCHAPMLASAKKEDIDKVFNLLSNGAFEYSCKSNESFELESTIRGGNLSLISHQLAVLDAEYFKSSTLLIEEISEYDYKVDRMLWQLKRAGVFKNCDAVMLGHFTDIEAGNHTIDGFRDYCIDLIAEESKVISALEIGHEDPNLPILLNHECLISAESNKLNIAYKGWNFDM